MRFQFVALLVFHVFCHAVLGQPCFDARIVSESVPFPSMVYAADLDGDGDIDLVSGSLTGSFFGPKIYWHENDGGSPPTFTERVVTTMIDPPQSVHAADLDGDGDVDVLSASDGDDRIAWFVNDGATPPNFTRRNISLFADSATDVYAADVDGDGDMDVLSASQFDDKIAWYENNGASPPVFIPRTITTTADRALAVHADDVDGDGDMDVLSASSFDDTIAWYENLGGSPPVFTKRIITNTAGGASSVFTWDLDGDGDRDVISASYSDDTIAWHENDGGSPPGFTEHVLTTGADGAIEIFVADLDDDGDPDVLAASYEGDTVAWFEHDGAADPAFTERIVSEDVDGATSVHAADVDGDGLPDVLATSYFEDAVTWFTRGIVENVTSGAHFDSLDMAIADAALGDMLVADTWNFETPCMAVLDLQGKPIELAATGSIVRSAHTTTVLADGGILRTPGGSELTIEGDLIVPAGAGAELAGGLVSMIGPISLGDGATLTAGLDAVMVGVATFSTGMGIPTTLISPRRAIVADINGDGYPDVVSEGSIGGDGAVVWFENSGGPNPVFPQRLVATSDESVGGIHAADVDGDGDTDVLAVAEFQMVVWYEHDGGSPPTFVRHVITMQASGAASVYAADVNGDGDMDVLSASTFDDTVAWYESDGGSPPSFTRRVITTTADFAILVRAGDMDGDGDIDVVSGWGNDNTIAWHENDGAAVPGFTEHVITTQVMNPSEIITLDLDDDGDLDVLGSSWLDNTVAWYENQGGSPPTFLERIITTDASFAQDVAATDVDGDGDIDVLSASQLDDTIAWYESDGGQPPTFTRRIVTETAELADSVCVGDLDGDGDDDVISVDDSDQPIKWFENLFDRRFDLVGASATIEAVGLFEVFNTRVQVDSGNVIGAGSQLIFDRSSTLAGTGTARAPSVASAGVMRPDLPGALIIDGDYEQFADIAPVGLRTGTLRADVSDVGSSTLDVTGTATLAGTLRVSAAAPFDPPVGAEFTVLTAAQIVDRFDVAFLPGLSGGKYLRVEYRGDVVTSGGGAAQMSVVTEGGDDSGVELTPSGSTRPSQSRRPGRPVPRHAELLSETEQQDRARGGNAPGALAGARASDSRASQTRGAGASVVLVVDTLDGNVDLEGGASFSASGPPNAAAVGDVDDDGDVDLAVTIRSDPPGQPGFVAVLYNDGTNSSGAWNGFSSEQTIQVNVGVDPNDLVIADIDNDGFGDISVVNRGDDTVSVLRNDGAGGFMSAIQQDTFFVGDDPRGIAAADLDGMNGADLAVTGLTPPSPPDDPGGAGILSILLNSGGIGQNWDGFDVPMDFATLTDPTDVDPADFDNDKDTDADLTITNTVDGVASVFVNLGSTSAEWDGFGPRLDVAVGRRPVNVIANGVDLNLDGFDDLVTANRLDGTVSIVLNLGDQDGDGAWDGGFGPSSDLEVGPNARSVAAAPLDEDDDQELAIVVDDEETGVRTVRVWRNDLTDGQLIFAPYDDVATAGSPLFVLATDVDMDGADDLITINESTGSGSTQASGNVRGGSGESDVSVVLNDLGAACRADVNGSGVVDFQDLTVVLGNYGGASEIGDVTGDGIVNDADLAAVLNLFRAECPTAGGAGG